MNKQLTWDIFCRVVDNFGDIGVCWRLARQLTKEFGHSVRLWVDDLGSLQRIWPCATKATQQWLNGVDVRHWSASFPSDVSPTDVVIEAFACDVPDSYLAAMAARKLAGYPPLWINLEYMSAEKWIEGCHLMTSIHPATGLRKLFFFPGFTSATGGLLREQNLSAAQERFDKDQFFKEINIAPKPGGLMVSLFAYENDAVTSLIEHWSGSSRPTHCLVPAGKVLTSIQSLVPQPLVPGEFFNLGNLCLEVIPFLTQTQYDQLLWACDVNFVRGEDSFVRAQWAAKPFVWHIYPQDDQAHMVKLNAFLDLFSTTTNTALGAKLTDFWRRWNEQMSVSDSWEALAALLPSWQETCGRWRQFLASQPDLATQLSLLATVSSREKTATEKPQSPV